MGNGGQTSKRSRNAIRQANAMGDGFDTGYQGGHMPGNPLKYPDDVATADRIVDGGLFPDDFLTNPREYLAPLTSVGEFNRIVAALKKVQGKPDALVTIYRGAPYNALNQGDWVTMSKDYAKQYVDSGGNSAGGVVVEYRVRAGDLSFDGDALEEMGYWGEPMTGKVVYRGSK